MSKKPNILLIFSDQFRWDGIHEIDGRQIATPNFDRLCREGGVFTRAFSPSPVCVPARISKFMGQYPCHTKVFDNEDSFVPNQKNMMETLHENGYYCHGIGKMHFVPDANGLNGFDSRERQEEILGNTQTDEYLKHLQSNGYDKVFDVHGQRSEMYYVPQISLLPEKDHPTNWIGERSVDFIRNYNEEKPLFLMSSFVHPHPPFCPPTPWNKLYRVPEIEPPFVPEEFEDLYVYINKVQNRYKFRDDGIDKKLVLTMRAFYFACISFIDFQVGKILEALDAKGILDETLIVFTSDHGEMLGDYNCFGKRCMLDSSAKIPFVVRYPSKVSGGGRYDVPVSLLDLLPTFLDTAGIDSNGLSLDGESLWDLIKNENIAPETELEGEDKIKTNRPTNNPDCIIISNETYTANTECIKSDMNHLANKTERHAKREFVYSQFSSGDTGLYMIAGKHEKLIYSAPDDKIMYFDNRITSREERNLWNDSSFKENALKMKEALIDFLAQNLPDAIENGDFKKYPIKQLPENKNEWLMYQDQPWCRDVESLIPVGYKVNLK